MKEWIVPLGLALFVLAGLPHAALALEQTFDYEVESGDATFVGYENAEEIGPELPIA